MFLLFALLLVFSAATQCAEEPLTPRSKRNYGLQLLRENDYKTFQELYDVPQGQFERHLQPRLPQKDRYSFTAIAAGLSVFSATHDAYNQEPLRPNIYGVLIMGAVVADAAYECGRERKLRIVVDDFLRKREERTSNPRARVSTPKQTLPAQAEAEPEVISARETFRSIREKEAAQAAENLKIPTTFEPLVQAAECDWQEISQREILEAAAAQAAQEQK